MYVQYSDFVVLFPNIRLNENSFKLYEKIAENAVWDYLGEQKATVIPSIQYTIMLTIQNMVALGMQPSTLAKTENEGGVSRTYRDNEKIIPKSAIDILNRYIDISI